MKVLKISTISFEFQSMDLELNVWVWSPGVQVEREGRVGGGGGSPAGEEAPLQLRNPHQVKQDILLGLEQGTIV